MRKLVAATLVAGGLFLSQGKAFAAEPSAICKDGTYSYSANRRGTCSGHGGVSEWLNVPTPKAPTKVTKQEPIDPNSPCGIAIRESIAPIADGWVERCVPTMEHAGTASFGEKVLRYNVKYLGTDMEYWRYVVAHERCHSQGIMNEIETDYCALEYGGNAWKYGYLSNLG